VREAARAVRLAAIPFWLAGLLVWLRSGAAPPGGSRVPASPPRDFVRVQGKPVVAVGSALVESAAGPAAAVGFVPYYWAAEAEAAAEFPPSFDSLRAEFVRDSPDGDCFPRVGSVASRVQGERLVDFVLWSGLVLEPAVAAAVAVLDVVAWIHKPARVGRYGPEPADCCLPVRFRHAYRVRLQPLEPEAPA
jgi:hypothetical protein